LKTSTADIVVVGGGIAGFAAAMSADAEGKSVILVERSGMLGGNATQSNVGTICGAYFRSKNSAPVFCGHRFGGQLIEDLIREGICNTPANYHEGLYILRYDWEMLYQFLQKELSKTNIVFLKNSAVTAVGTGNHVIAGLTIERDGKPERIEGAAVIDCSGNAVISALANIPLLSSGEYQAASQIFRVSCIEAAQEFMVNMALKRAVHNLSEERKWPKSFQSLSIIPGSLKNGVADLKFVLPDPVNDDTGLPAEFAGKAKKHVEEIFSALQISVAFFRNAAIEVIFPMPGIRIQKRSKGRYILTEEDVLECRKFDNGIALGAWPIEEWKYDGSLAMQYFKEKDGYHIPSDCLQSAELKNLFFAGKNISATDKAIASARVMGTCLQTGFAAGKLACCNTAVEQKKMIALLQQELMECHG
jgi:hypothetical protein